MTEPAYDDYLKIAAEWEAEFARNKALYREKIHCRKGCTDCCSHLFQITELEAAYISRGVKELPPEVREHLAERARQYLARRTKLFGNFPDVWGSLPPPGMRLPCPALEDGACQIYSHRPLICRKFGVPLYNPQRPDFVSACELNFQSREEIEVTDLVQIQTGIHDRWADVNAEYNRQGGQRDSKPLTVARAIVEDFQPYLPKST